MGRQAWSLTLANHDRTLPPGKGRGAARRDWGGIGLPVACQFPLQGPGSRPFLHAGFHSPPGDRFGRQSALELDFEQGEVEVTLGQFSSGGNGAVHTNAAGEFTEAVDGRKGLRGQRRGQSPRPPRRAGAGAAQGGHPGLQLPVILQEQGAGAHCPDGKR